MEQAKGLASLSLARCDQLRGWMGVQQKSLHRAARWVGDPESEGGERQNELNCFKNEATVPLLHS